MKDDNYGIKLIQKYEPTATPQPTDLVSAQFSCGSFRNTYGQMTAEERNSMRERHWYRDPSVDAWVYCPPYFSEGIRNTEPISEEISRNNDDSQVVMPDIVASPEIKSDFP